MVRGDLRKQHMHMYVRTCIPVGTENYTSKIKMENAILFNDDYRFSYTFLDKPG